MQRKPQKSNVSNNSKKITFHFFCSNPKHKKVDIINNDIDMDDVSISSEVSHDMCKKNNIEENQARDNVDNAEIKKEELTPEKHANDFISNYFSAFDNNPEHGTLKLCTTLISTIFKSEVAGGMLGEESLEFF